MAPEAARELRTVLVANCGIAANVKQQLVTIRASALLTVTGKAQGLNLIALELSADLSGLQQNITGILGSELDRNDRGGDRIVIQHARPRDPASLVAVELHYGILRRPLGATH